MSGMAISASGRDGVAVVSAVAGRTLAFLGASCPASAVPGNDGLSSISFSPKKGEDAVVALVTLFEPGGKNPNVREGGLVRLYWDNDKLIVDTDKPFVPPADRLGQVVPSGEILQVTTRGQTFVMSTTEDRYRKMYEGPLTARGARIVNDANLLCRYLVGQATFEELDAVASGDTRTAEQVRMAGLEAALSAKMGELADLKGQYEELNRHRVGLEVDLSARIGDLEDHRGEIGLLECELREVRQELSSVKQMYTEECGRSLNLRNQLNRTFGAKWRRFWEKVSTRR